jgi:hypothetical protein
VGGNRNGIESENEGKGNVVWKFVSLERSVRVDLEA